MPASLPDNPLYCFCPFNDSGGPPRIRILVEGLAFTMPIALVCVIYDTAPRQITPTSTMRTRSRPWKRSHISSIGLCPTMTVLCPPQTPQLQP